MSIATQGGDDGQTGLIGGSRVSKADLRVEAYGTVDELNAALGLARSLCSHPEIPGWTEEIQRTLFRVGSALATPPSGKESPSAVNAADVQALTERVHSIESQPGILADWSIPGAYTQSAAYEVARTVCRRAERSIVRLAEGEGQVGPHVLPYINRLSDLLWLFGRLLELEAGVDSKLRDNQHAGARWSKAW